MSTNYYFSPVDPVFVCAGTITHLLATSPNTGTGTDSFSVPGHGTLTVYYGTETPGDPQAAGITGDYITGVRLSLGSNCTAQIQLHRVTDLGAIEASSGYVSVTSAGGWTHTWTALNLGTWLSGDHIVAELKFTNSGGPAQNCGVMYDPTNDVTYHIQAPWGGGGGGGNAAGTGPYWFTPTLSDIAAGSISGTNPVQAAYALSQTKPTSGMPVTVTVPGDFNNRDWVFISPSGDPGASGLNGGFGARLKATFTGSNASQGGQFGYVKIFRLRFDSGTSTWVAQEMSGLIDQFVSKTVGEVFAAHGWGTTDSWQAGDRLMVACTFYNSDGINQTVSVYNSTQGGGSSDVPAGDCYTPWGGPYASGMLTSFGGMSYHDPDPTYSLFGPNFQIGASSMGGIPDPGDVYCVWIARESTVSYQSGWMYPAAWTQDHFEQWFDGGRYIQVGFYHYVWSGPSDPTFTASWPAGPGLDAGTGSSTWIEGGAVLAKGAGGSVAFTWQKDPALTSPGTYIEAVPGYSGGAYTLTLNDESYRPSFIAGTWLLGPSYAVLTAGYWPGSDFFTVSGDPLTDRIQLSGTGSQGGWLSGEYNWEYGPFNAAGVAPAGGVYIWDRIGGAA